MKKTFLTLFTIIFSFLIFSNDAGAKSAMCFYSTNGGTYGIRFQVDESGFTYETVGNSSVYTIDKVDATLNNFKVKPNDDSNDLKCPPEIKASMKSDRSGAIVSFSFDTDDKNYYSYPIYDSKIDNDSETVDKKTGASLVRTCVYGPYTVSVWSDGSVEPNRSGYNVSINDPDNKFNSSCPDDVYITDSNGSGGNYASISTVLVAGSQNLGLLKKIVVSILMYVMIAFLILIVKHVLML